MTKAWDREKARMHELYMVRNMKLSQMQEIMLKQHNFSASERAYKQKFKEWKWFKKTPVLDLLPRLPHPFALGMFQYEFFVGVSDEREREGERERVDKKLIRNSQRNQSVNPEAMINIGRPPATSRPYPHPGADLRRCSDSSSLNSMDHHHSQMSPPTSYADPSVSPEHGVYPASQHGLLSLGSVHSPPPIVRDTYQISLPPVSEIQLLPFKETVKESVRTAQIHLDSGDMEVAGDYLEHALKTLQWLTSKGCR
ncbi:unnamed protein product [Tuber aestivum]|uniref:Clr5 domain-containing protein n=1 Tax=Tuber aestivum TaxID=59557 RepID=A0A292PY28_9PEZI|nr:unnamed protein product [Tuber aestivum]